MLRWCSKSAAPIDFLQNIHSKSSLDIHNIETAFALFEMCNMVRNPIKDIDTDRLVKDIPLFIAETIEKTLRYPLNNVQKGLGSYTGKDVSSPAPYGDFAGLILDLKAEALNHDVSVITFNYDVAIDVALIKAGLDIDYGLEEEHGGMPLLKLHGSLAWASCAKCPAIIPRDLSGFLKQNYGIGNKMPEYVPFRTRPNSDGFTHDSCNNAAVNREPFLVPPTWSKRSGHEKISGVWSRAAADLSEASNIVVIGYSLPESDEFFRHLYAVSTANGPVLDRFWVFNPDDTGTVDQRFQALLGHGARQRYRFWRERFSKAIGIIKEELKT